ncbi:hypothetical protein LEMLEM_LOCUS837, partial [Lemmus lemmus]
PNSLETAAQWEQRARAPTLSQTRKDEPPGTSHPSYSSPSPRDWETTFSKKNLGRNCSSDVSITPSSWETRLPPPTPQLTPKSRLLFYPGKLLTRHVISSPGDTHCSGFHIHPAASHANLRSHKQFLSTVAPVPSRPTQP